MNEEQKTRGALYKKIQKVREAVNQADWTPDALYTMGSSIVRYISADKIKRTMAPILVENGLDLELEYSDLHEEKELAKKPFHWTVKLTATLIDCDTGCSTSSTVYGESSAVDDKGCSMVETIALRRYFEQKFLIADMLDSAKAEGGAYSKPTGMEAEEVRSKVLGNATKPAAPAAPAKPAPAPAKPAPAPAKPAKPAKPAAPAAPAKPAKVDEVITVDINTLPEGIPTVNRNMIAKMIDEWYNAFSEGTVPTARYAEMAEAFNNIENSLDAATFIKAYRVVE